MELNVLVAVLAGLILAGILWLVKVASDTKTEVAVLTERIETSLDKHLIPEVQRLSDRADIARDAARDARSVAERLDERVLQTERGIDQLWKVHRTPQEPA